MKIEEEIKQKGTSENNSENKVASDRERMCPGRSGFWVKIADKLREGSRKWDNGKWKNNEGM